MKSPLVPSNPPTPDNKPTSRFMVSRVQGGEQTWERYGLKLADILAQSMSEEVPRLVINELVGYSSWYQAAFSRYDIWAEPFQVHEDRELIRSELRDVHKVMGEVGWTAILPEYQDQGGWSLLMNTVEEDLRQNGNKYMLRGIRTANGYEESIERRYKERILFTSIPIDEPFYPVTCSVNAL